MSDAAVTDGVGCATGVVDVVVLTALPVERAAMVAALGNCSVRRWRGRDLDVGAVNGRTVLVFPLGGMGNVGAAASGEQVIDVWNPAEILLVGIAGGTRDPDEDVCLGDVLVPEQVVGYELGKATAGGLKRRYEVYRPDHDLLTVAKSVPVTRWAPAIGAPRPAGAGRGVPRAHFGPVFSGEKVLADGESLTELRAGWPRATGVEMESLGVALAAYRGGPAFLMAKGVSDFADTDKNDAWHEYAAEAAARFAVALLGQLGRPPVADRPQATPSAGTGSFPGALKLRVCRRLLADWEDVADHFDVPPYARARFRDGNQPRDLWECLEIRGKVYALPAALDEVGRPDLANLLRHSHVDA